MCFEQSVVSSPTKKEENRKSSSKNASGLIKNVKQESGKKVTAKSSTKTR